MLLHISVRNKMLDNLKWSCESEDKIADKSPDLSASEVHQAVMLGNLLCEDPPIQ